MTLAVTNGRFARLSLCGRGLKRMWPAAGNNRLMERRLDESKPIQFNVKCDPEKAIELRERYDCVKPGYHMNKKHWNTIVCDGTVPDMEMLDWISHSYELVVGSLPLKDKKKLSA